MIKQPGVIVLALSGFVAATACTDAADQEAQSLAQWKAYCTAQGKQFLWKDTATDDQMLMTRVQVEGKCVGPGERGYRAPEPSQDEP